MTGTKPEDSTMMENMAWWLYKPKDTKQNQPDEIKEVHRTVTKRGVSKMLRFIHLLYIIPFLFIPVFNVSGNIKNFDPSSVIQVKDNLLTVKVRDIPLKKVLMDIAKQKQIKIDFYTSAEDTLITNFSSLPMEKGLKKLLRNYNYTFIKGGEHEIRKVIVLSNGGESRHRRMEPVIAYTEEPPLYDDTYAEDLDYQENEDIYAEDLDYQEGEDMYAEDLDYLEGEDMYDEDPDYLESEDMYVEDLDFQEREDMYAEDLDFQESEDMYAEDLDFQESEDLYVEDSDMLEEDISERPGYSGGGHFGLN